MALDNLTHGYPEVNNDNSRLLPAVGGPGVEAGVALAADHLVRVVLLRQQAQGRLDHAASQAQHQVQGRLCNREEFR